MTISVATPPSHLRYLMELERPWQATIENDLRIVARRRRARTSPGPSAASWASGPSCSRCSTTPMQRVGSDLESGLAKLKALVER